MIVKNLALSNVQNIKLKNNNFELENRKEKNKIIHNLLYKVELKNLR